MLLRFTLAQPADVVFDHLTDPHKFVSVHPVISRMEPLGTNRYRVYETLRLGGLPFSFTYRAAISADEAAKTVRIDASVFGLTRIDMHFRVVEQDGKTVVEEDVTFQSVLPVKPLMEKVFRQQHRRLFQNIENVGRETA